MDVSVVVPTLNARDQLAGCLDSLTDHARGAEVIVVNGPSSDGTTGMVRDRNDVDVLVELADRRIATARNAGIDRARGDVIAFVDHTAAVTDGWKDAIERSLGSAAVVTGPSVPHADGGDGVTEPESQTLVGRDVSYFDPGNVAFDRTVLDELDGYDEYLEIGGSRDLAHRIAGRSYDVGWDDEMQLARTVGTDGGERQTDWGWKYRSLAYRLVKNYSVRPTVLGRLGAQAATDCVQELRAVARGETQPSEWVGTGKHVMVNIAAGVKKGAGARRQDRTVRRNPNGRSARTDRAVSVYDWR